MLHVVPPSLSTDSAAEPSPRAVIGRQLSMLTRLAEIGMEIAEEAGRRAKAAPDEAESGDRGDPALAYARAARAVRLTIALQSRLLNDLAALDRDRTRAEAAGVFARRHRIRTLVERAMEAGRDDADEVERLRMEVWERLTDEDDADIAGRPLEEIVSLICADLGLSPEQTASAMAQAAGSAGALSRLPAEPLPPFAPALAGTTPGDLTSPGDIPAETG